MKKTALGAKQLRAKSRDADLMARPPRSMRGTLVLTAARLPPEETPMDVERLAVRVDRRRAGRVLLGAAAALAPRWAQGADGPRAAPRISDVRAEDVTAATATIAWVTDALADGAVEYGTTPALGQAVADGGLTTEHRLALTGLAPKTTYHYRVRSANGGGAAETKADRSFTAAAAPGPPAPSQTPGLGYVTLNVAGDGAAVVPYQVWVAWSPAIVPTPDGGAWAFASAQAEHTDGSLGAKKLYAWRCDAATRSWSVGTPLPGGQIQFGASAAVDAKGTVHVVYSDRADDQPTSYSTLMHIMSTPDGGWTDPIAVSDNPAAGHQLSPDLVIDKHGAAHVIWQDQRDVDQANRDAAASNADIFASDLGADGAWSSARQVSAARPDATTNASRPQIAVDGDRLVAAWSVYTLNSGIDSAARLDWSTRPLHGSAHWSKPRQMITRQADAYGNSDQIGGRLLALVSDPTGGVGLVFGRDGGGINNLFAEHLAAGGKTWSRPVTLATGDRGTFPAAAYQPDGTLIVVYNVNTGDVVSVGEVTLAANAPTPSAEVSLTAGEGGDQGRAALAADASGNLWVMYMHAPFGGVSNEFRVRASHGGTLFAAPAKATRFSHA